jgi:ATP/maltotriose-dependent transcriptional regulator MalT
MSDNTATPKGKSNPIILLLINKNHTSKEPNQGALASAQGQRQDTGGGQVGQNVVADKVAPKVLKLRAEGNSIRDIAGELKISKTTVSGRSINVSTEGQ